MNAKNVQDRNPARNAHTIWTLATEKKMDLKEEILKFNQKYGVTKKPKESKCLRCKTNPRTHGELCHNCLDELYDKYTPSMK